VSARTGAGVVAGRRLPDDNARGNFSTDFTDRAQEWRRLLAELVGTFALTFVAAGGAVLGHVGTESVGRAAAVVAPALLVMAMIYTVGDVSGAHFNPAVTLAFALRKDFPWSRVPGYWVAQVIGAVIAAAVLRAMFGTAGHLGATLPHGGTLRSVVMEAVLTWLLITVILGTAEGHKLVGHNAAIASGGYIALAGLFASPISGASMNPARSLGPDLVAATMSSYWVYLVGPLVGALAAVALAAGLHGGPTAAERHAAQG
jgi:aquaporin Z